MCAPCPGSSLQRSRAFAGRGLSGRGSPSAEAVDVTGGDDAVAVRYTDSICACHTAACLDRVEDAYSTWKWKMPHGNPSRAFLETMHRENECYGGVMSRGGDVAFYARVAEIATPACEDYVKAFEALVACPSASPSDRQPFVHAIEQLNIRLEKNRAVAPRGAGADLQRRRERLADEPSWADVRALSRTAPQS